MSETFKTSQMSEFFDVSAGSIEVNPTDVLRKSHYDFEFKNSNYPEEKNLKIGLSQERPL